MPVIAKRAPAKAQFTSWSATRYLDYSACPKRAQLKHLLHKQFPFLKEPGNAAMDRGTEIHAHAEGYIKGEHPVTRKKVARLHPELTSMADRLKMLRTLYKKSPGQVICEDNWAFRTDWSQTRWDDWTGCAVRIKLDVAWSEGTTLHIGDWKTGKFSEYKLPDYLLQQELYGLAGLLKYPKAELVKPVLLFTDANVAYPRDPAIHPGTQDPPFEFTRKDEPKLIKLWDKRIKPMMNDTSFKATPGNACKFCYYRANGPLADNPLAKDLICKYKG
jgi:hypothetical protein